MRSIAGSVASIALVTCVTSAALGGPASVGVKAGASLAGVDRPGAPVSFDWKWGPTAGLFVTYSLNSALAIQPAVRWISKGFSYGKAESTDQSGASTGQYEALQAVDYLEVPVLLKMSAPKWGAVRAYALLGPAVAFEVREQLKLTGALEESRDSDLPRGADVGLNVGAGFGWRLGRVEWLIEAQYVHGLTDLAASAPWGYKSRALVLQLGASL